jgi:competence protein ComEC
VRIRLQKKDDGDLGSGDSVRIRALIRPPALPSYPGAWDLQRDAFYSGLGASGYALAKAERTTQAVPSGPMRFVQWLREGIAHRVVAVIPGAAGAVSVTLLTGSSMAIPEADHAAFRDSGLAHLLAVAGLHIGIVMGFGLAISASASPSANTPAYSGKPRSCPRSALWRPAAPTWCLPACTCRSSAASPWLAS